MVSFEHETGRGQLMEWGGDTRGDGEHREEREVEVQVEPESISKRECNATDGVEHDAMGLKSECKTGEH